MNEDELWQRIRDWLGRPEGMRGLGALAESLDVSKAVIYAIIKKRTEMRPEGHLVVPKETLDALLSQIDKLSTENAELKLRLMGQD